MTLFRLLGGLSIPPSPLLRAKRRAPRPTGLFPHVGSQRGRNSSLILLAALLVAGLSVGGLRAASPELQRHSRFLHQVGKGVRPHAAGSIHPEGGRLAGGTGAFRSRHGRLRGPSLRRRRAAPAACFPRRRRAVRLRALLPCPGARGRRGFRFGGRHDREFSQAFSQQPAAGALVATASREFDTRQTPAGSTAAVGRLARPRWRNRSAIT